MVVLKHVSRGVFLSLAGLAFVSCGSTGVQNQTQSPAIKQTSGNSEQAGAVSGSYTSLSGQTVSLADDSGKPTVLMFGSFFCSECTREANLYLNSLRNRAFSPRNVNIHTVMVGTSQEEAVKWLRDNPVPWKVGLDSVDSALIKEKCGVGSSVPCTLIYKDGKLMMDKPLQRVISRFDIEKITGAWE